MDHEDEHGILFPWQSLTQFQRLILVKILRSDMLTASCSQFVRDSIGEKYLSAGSFDLKEIYEESTAKTPLIFILSPSMYHNVNHSKHTLLRPHENKTSLLLGTLILGSKTADFNVYWTCF